ncbi:cytochrome P450 [Amycolatopsis nivea]|uniref:cytochrome P450 n=1 Tax=Amycolatopsis nivea TaxID=1644109 RepID=UPI00107043D6|nr:cytochrome P450 [Amycolatopsis nivea]
MTEPSNPRHSADYDHLDRSLTRDQVWDAYTEMRERCPVAHNSRHGGHLHVLRYEEVRATANRAADFSSADGAFIPPSGLPRLAPIDYDGDEHLAWRAAMQAPLTPAAVRALAPDLAEVVDRHIDAFAGTGTAELFSALAEPIPAHVVGRVAGLSPADCGVLREVAIAAFQSIGTPSFGQRKSAFDAFIRGQLDQRRREPRDDYLSRLASGKLGDRELGDDDIIGVLMTLLLGGHHSTAAAMAGLLHHVLTEPGLREVVAEGGAKLSALVEESLRLTTPLHIFARTATNDTAIGDTPVAKGTRLFLNYASANHDPRRFPDPEAFRLDRTPNPHVAFGFGAHLCLGRHLARAELKEVVTRLFARLPDIRLSGDIAYSTLQGGKLLEIEHLPVVFTPESA